MAHFDSKEFLRQLDAGVFDGRITEEIKKLSHDQLLEISRILEELERREESTEA